ncbi:MAG: ABC transporter ATP-binding protein [Bacteroidota bacterium]
MSAVIKVENLSKAYQLGEIGTGTISRDLERFWAKMRGKEDPFLKIGAVNDRALRGESDVVWSLKDLNFEIEQGDAVGIIGRNGAGKSTLLKILSRVTAPTTGSVKVKGRIASLLEVGTGFHPDLSGRENIYLNGAILGMRKAEIKRKFDEIVDFSGVERYVDTPVKRYSSGMYVRLAFAVAAHLESEILIVDEVLSVGDAEFQKKCLGKMGDVSKGEGRTVLFVSHNMTAVQNLCNKGIVLENGNIVLMKPIADCVSYYLTSSVSSNYAYINSSNEGTHIKKLRITNSRSEVLERINSEEDCFFELTLVNEQASNLNFGFTLFNEMEIPLMSKVVLDDLTAINKGETTLQIRIPTEILVSGRYTLEGALWDDKKLFDKNNAYLTFDYVSDSSVEKSGQKYLGLMRFTTKWIIANES